jgi:drug/metabolite transporter (DMT)-like permease
MLGALLAIAAAVFFSLNILTVKRGVMRVGMVQGMAIMLVVGTITIILAALIFEGPQAILRASGLSLLYFSAAGIIHFLGGWGFLNSSARLIGSARLSAMTSLTPVFAGLIALVALQEKLNLFSSFGLVFIVAGLYLTTTSKT